MDAITPIIDSTLSFSSNPWILAVLVVVGFFSIMLYMAFLRMQNNPYVVDSLMKKYAFNMVKKKYRIITVNYLRVGHNNNIIIQAIRRELLGSKGLYLEYIDTTVNIPSEYFISGAGEDDILYYVLTEQNIGYPIKLELIKDIEPGDSKFPEPVIAGLLASKKKHDLFTSQHFKALAQGVKNRVGRGKSQFDRLLESGIPAIFIVTIALSFLLMYQFALNKTGGLEKDFMTISGNIFKLQHSFMERDRYCQVFISRYGSQEELNKYLSMPTGFENFIED